jgi:hypothetical protein
LRFLSAVGAAFVGAVVRVRARATENRNYSRRAPNKRHRMRTQPSSDIHRFANIFRSEVEIKPSKIVGSISHCCCHTPTTKRSTCRPLPTTIAACKYRVDNVTLSEVGQSVAWRKKSSDHANTQMWYLTDLTKVSTISLLSLSVSIFFDNLSFVIFQLVSRWRSFHRTPNLHSHGRRFHDHGL